MSSPSFGFSRYAALVGGLAIIAACGGARDEGPAEASSSSGAPAPAPASSASTCDPSAARDVVVASDDLNGYPPYAVAECSLVYVSSSGDLMLRDLATTAEVKLAPVSEKPRRPTVAIDVDGDRRTLLVAWESTLAAGPAVRVSYGDRVSTVAGEFVMATEPRARDHFVAFTAWKGTTASDDTDVWLYDARTDTARPAIGGPGQQRFADVSGTHVVATDFSEDPDGRFDGANDLAVLDIASSAVTRRAVPGKQAFPMLSSKGALAYLSWNAVQAQPTLESYVLMAGSVLGDPGADHMIARVKYSSPEPARPAFAGETLEWIADPDGVTALYRAPADGSAAPARAFGQAGLLLYAPASSSGTRADFTVLAASRLSSADRTPRLHAVGR